MLGGFLDLPHALEIAYRRGNVFDADPQQGRHRDREQLGEFFQRLDLGEFTLLEPVKRRARNTEAVGDLVGTQPGAETKGFEAVADIVEANGHDVPYHPPSSILQGDGAAWACSRFAASSAAMTMF